HAVVFGFCRLRAGRDIDGDDGSVIGIFLHHIHRNIVDDAAIDEEIVVPDDGRKNSGRARTGEDALGERAAVVDLDFGAVEDGRDTKIGGPEIFNLHVAADLADHLPHFEAAGEADERKGEVAEGGDAAAAETVDHLAALHAEGPKAGDHGAHAGAADEIDGNVCLFQGPQDADVGDAAGKSSSEHEA